VRDATRTSCVTRVSLKRTGAVSATNVPACFVMAALQRMAFVANCAPKIIAMSVPDPFNAASARTKFAMTMIAMTNCLNAQAATNISAARGLVVVSTEAVN